MLGARLDTIWEQAIIEDLKCFDIGESYALRSSKPKSKYILLEDLGKEIWDSLTGDRDWNKMVDWITHEFIVDRETVMQDLYDFALTLIHQGLIHCEEASGWTKEAYGSGESHGEEPAATNYDVIYNKYMEGRKPFKLFVELTYGCNLTCKHCYLGEPSTAAGLSLDKYIEILDQMKEYGVVELTFTGGEAALHPNYLDIVEYASRKGFVVTLLTNGTLLTEQETNRLKKLELHEVRISIYGFEQFHDEFVGMKGAFEKSLHSLQQLGELGTAAIVLTGDNVDEMNRLIPFLTSLGIEASYTPLITPTIYGGTEPMGHRLTGERLRQCIEDLQLRLGGSICTAGISRFRITPEGEINPCEMLRTIEFGNLREHSFSNIMESAERQQWMERFASLTASPCSGCGMKKYCTNCIGLALLETGDMSGISSFACELAAAQHHYWEKS